MACLQDVLAGRLGVCFGRSCIFIRLGLSFGTGEAHLPSAVRQEYACAVSFNSRLLNTARFRPGPSSERRSVLDTMFVQEEGGYDEGCPLSPMSPDYLHGVVDARGCVLHGLGTLPIFLHTCPISVQ